MAIIPLNSYFWPIYKLLLKFNDTLSVKWGNNHLSKFVKNHSLFVTSLLHFGDIASDIEADFFGKHFYHWATTLGRDKQFNDMISILES